MAERAQVSSLERIEAFRSSLIIYLEKAGRALEEVNDEVKRTRLWLETEQRVFWEHETRRRARKMEEVQQQLFSARLSSFQGSYSAEQLAVQKARRALAEARDKLKKVKQWNRHFESRVEPLARQVDMLRDVLGHHMGEAVRHLTQVTRTLSDYADLRPASRPASGTGSADGEDEP